MVITSAPASAMGPAATRGSSRSNRSTKGKAVPSIAAPATPPQMPPRRHRATRACPSQISPTSPTAGPGRQPEHQSRGQFVGKPSRDHLPRRRLPVQYLESQAHRLAADTLRQVQHHGDEERERHHTVQLVLVGTGEERRQDAGREVAAQPGEAPAEGTQR